MWVVFEGLDGAGTTTQLARFHDYLIREKKIEPESVFLTAEPTEGPIGTVCRKALRGEIQLNPLTLALAFSADRSDHLFRNGGVLERRSRGHWILMDRYLYSTLAYQDCGPPKDWLLSLCSQFPRPDLLVFLETPVEVCLQRLSNRKDNTDIFEKRSELERIRESYRWVLEVETERTRLLRLDGCLSMETVAEKVQREVERLLQS